MRDIILILALIFLFLLGYYIVRKVDDFIENGGFSDE